MRICTKCGIEKEITEFHKSKGGIFNIRGECIECRKEWRKEYQQRPETKKKSKIYNKNHYILNSDNEKNYGKIHSEERNNNRLKALYGITLEQYNQMLKDQNGVCAICKQPETAIHQNGKIKRLAVDHNHKTGQVRGLACDNCNHGIGFFKENKKILLNAINYLKQYEE